MIKHKIKKYKWFRILRFLKHYLMLKQEDNGRFPLRIKDFQLEIDDWIFSHPFDRHYIYHVAWAFDLARMSHCPKVPRVSHALCI